MADGWKAHKRWIDTDREEQENNETVLVSSRGSGLSTPSACCQVFCRRHSKESSEEGFEGAYEVE